MLTGKITSSVLELFMTVFDGIVLRLHTLPLQDHVGVHCHDCSHDHHISRASVMSLCTTQNTTEGASTVISCCVQS